MERVACLQREYPTIESRLFGFLGWAQRGETVKLGAA